VLFLTPFPILCFDSGFEGNVNSVDNRFVITYYNDDSLRPINNRELCVGPSETDFIDTDNHVVEFNSCSNGEKPTTTAHQQWSWQIPIPSTRQLRSLQGCTPDMDTPSDWYDTYGKHSERSNIIRTRTIALVPPRCCLTY